MSYWRNTKEWAMNKGKTLLPKLRFPGFREAEGWETKLMAEVYAFKGTNSLSREKLNYEAGSLKNIHYGDIHTKFSTHFDIRKELVPYISPPESLKEFKAENFCIEGDMIFADASEDLEDIGKAIEIVGLNGESVLSGLHTILARQTEANLVVGFGGHLFKSNWVRNQIQKEAQGTKVLGISNGRLAKIKIPFPRSSTEQRKIADCLGSVEELIAAQARKVDALKKCKSGLVQQLFPGDGATQPLLRFPGFEDAGKWEVRRLDTIGRVIRGASPRPQGDPRYYGGPVPRLMVQDVTRDGKWVTPRIDSLTNEGAKLSRPCSAGTLTIVCSGTVGVASFLAVDACIHDGFLALIDIDESIATKDFLFHSLSTLRLQFEEGATHGGVFTNLTTSGIQQFEIKCPKADEQQRIAACLSNLDDLINSAIQKINVLRIHKKGLMQRLFPSSEDLKHE
ncbi:MAG: restriction endonuclease subunit S [Polaromonas sp.]